MPLVPATLYEDRHLCYKNVHKKLTGIPGVIDTSFNRHEEPIVCSPADARRSFQDGRLGCVALGNFLVRSPEVVATASAARQAAV